MDERLTKKDTIMLKGVAVIWMLMHHLWAWPDRIADGGLQGVLYIGGRAVYEYVGHFGKICVPMFFFLSGYGLYKSYANRTFDIWGRVKKLYVAYWKVFIIVVPAAFLFFGTQGIYAADAAVCGRYNEFSFSECIGNFLAFSDSYNSEWWFLRCYAIAMIGFPLVKHAVDKRSLTKNMLTVLALVALFGKVFPIAGHVLLGEARDENVIYNTICCLGEPFPACFVMGTVCAKEGLLDKVEKYLAGTGVFRILLEILFLVAVIPLRQSLLHKYFDFVFIPLLCVVLADITERLPEIRHILETFGLESTNMWLTHTFFCYYFYDIVRIVIAPRWPVASLLILILISYAAARCVNEIYVRVPALSRLGLRRVRN